MNRKYISNSILRQIFFIIIASFLVLIVLYHLKAFLPGFLGAFCLYVLLIHPLRYLVYKKRFNRVLSIILLMTASVLVIVTPLVFLINVLTEKVGQAIDNKQEIQKNIEKGLSQVNKEFGIDLLSEINLGDVTSIAIKIVQEILNTSIDGVVQLAIAYLILYFMLMNFHKMEKWFYKHIPLKAENLKILNKDLRDLVISNAVGVPLVALIQAIFAYAGYLIFGLDDAFNWFIITIFAAMVPVVGTAAVYVPACIFMLASGQTTNAYLLFLYCLIVVGASDNIFRFWLQKIMADVHPLITIFGVIIGVKLFGFIGIIFGPIFLSLVLWLFRIYRLEFTNHQKKDSIKIDQKP